jgi:hypothetical protein
MKVRSVMKLPFTLLLLVFITSFFCGSSFATDIGSWTTPSRLGHQTFSAASNNINGFIFLDDSLELQSSTVTCTWNTTYPVRGPMTLNGGMIYLEQDFVFSNSAEILKGSAGVDGNVGFIDGYGKTMDFSESMSALEFDKRFLIMENLYLNLNTNTKLEGALEFRGTSTLDCKGHILDLSSSGTIALGENANLSICNARIKGLASDSVDDVFGRLTMGGTSHLYLSDLTLVLSSNYSLTVGNMDIYGDVYIEGDSNTFTHKNSDKITINADSTLYLGRGVTYNHNTDADDLVLRSGSVLNGNGSTIAVASGKSLTLDTGTFVVNDKVTIDDNGSGLTLGDNITLYISSGSTLELIDGTITYGS